MIELGQTVSIRAIDDQRIGERNIEAVLDDSGGNEHVEFMMHETRHHLFQLFLPHLAMRNAQSSVRANPSDEIGERVNRFDTVMDHVHLSTSLQLETDRIFDDHGLEFHNNRLDGEPITRRGFDHRHVA